MYYELYVDVFLFTNFVMDFIILTLVKKIQKCTASYWRIFFGSLIGSFGMLLILIVPISNFWLRVIPLHLLTLGFMVRIGLKSKGFADMSRNILLVYVFTFVIGGVLQWVYQYTVFGFAGRRLIPFLVLSGIVYGVVRGLSRIYLHMREKKQYFYPVLISFGGKKLERVGILDTGNQLVEPISKKPVSILNREDAKELLGENLETGYQKLRAVPFHSIGKDKGILMAFLADSISIYEENKVVTVMDTWIGISEAAVSVGKEYHMIINPRLVKE